MTAGNTWMSRMVMARSSMLASSMANSGSVPVIVVAMFWCWASVSSLAMVYAGRIVNSSKPRAAYISIAMFACKHMRVPSSF
jgi:hypothetical protein